MLRNSFTEDFIYTKTSTNELDVDFQCFGIVFSSFICSNYSCNCVFLVFICSSLNNVAIFNIAKCLYLEILLFLLSFDFVFSNFNCLKVPWIHKANLHHFSLLFAALIFPPAKTSLSHYDFKLTHNFIIYPLSSNASFAHCCQSFFMLIILISIIMVKRFIFVVYFLHIPLHIFCVKSCKFFTI